VTLHRLDRLVHPPAAGGKPRSVIVILHGLAGSSASYADIGPIWGPVLPHTEFVVPDAPEPNDLAPTATGRQWFSTLQRDLRGMMQSVAAAAPVLDGFLDEILAERGLDERRMALLGFSQGAMIALHVGLRRAVAPAGIVGFSAMLLAGPELRSEIRARPPVLLIHGEDDALVPVSALDAAVAMLRAVGVPVAAERRPGLDHRADEAGLQRCVAFMMGALNVD
jgi:phospholipase/carboxylesterase